MVPRISIKTARDIAAQAGMADADSATVKAVKAFLVSQADDISPIGTDGEPINLKKVTISVATEGEDVEVIDGNAMPEEDPEDPEAKMEDEDEDGEKAGSADRVKRLEREVARLSRKNWEDDRRSKGHPLGVSYVGTHAEKRKAAYERAAKSRRKHNGAPTFFSSADRAEQFGALMRLEAMGSKAYARRDEDAKIAEKALGGVQPGNGGSLVQSEFLPELIDNLDEYGVTRKLVREYPMSNHTLDVPRKTADVTMSYVSENGEISTQDKPNFDIVKLVAVKGTAIVPVSNELLVDAAVDIAGIIGESLLRSAAYAEDNALINGDGTSTYGGQTGLVGKITSASASWVSGTGSSWSALTEGDIFKTRGKVRTKFRNNMKILCSEEFADEVIERVRFAAGAAAQRGDIRETEEGRPPRVYGASLITSELAPSNNAAASTANMWIGDFDSAIKFGTVRNGMSIESSSDRYFEFDQIAWRICHRFNVNVHEGDDTSVAGPVVALATSS